MLCLGKNELDKKRKNEVKEKSPSGSIGEKREKKQNQRNASD